MGGGRAGLLVATITDGVAAVVVIVGAGGGMGAGE